MREIGKVVSKEGGRLIISVERTDACAKCGKCDYAHVRFGNDENIHIEAIPQGEFEIGDFAEVELANDQYLSLVFKIYLLPLILAGLGYGGGTLLGRAIGQASLWGGIFAAASFALSFLWLHQYDKSAKEAGKYLPVARPVNTFNYMR